MNIEELFLEAESDIKKNAHADALRKFEPFCTISLIHTPAYNSLFRSTMKNKRIPQRYRRCRKKIELVLNHKDWLGEKK